MRRDALLIGFLSLAVVAVLMVSGFAGATSSRNSSAQRAERTSAVSVNLDQYANDPGQGWQNGDLNGNNSAYHEGSVVPFRYLITGISAGQHQVDIQYDFTAGGHEAYDFLATYNATDNANL